MPSNHFVTRRFLTRSPSCALAGCAPPPPACPACPASAAASAVTAAHTQNTQDARQHWQHVVCRAFASRCAVHVHWAVSQRLVGRSRGGCRQQPAGPGARPVAHRGEHREPARAAVPARQGHGKPVTSGGRASRPAPAAPVVGLTVAVANRDRLCRSARGLRPQPQATLVSPRALAGAGQGCAAVVPGRGTRASVALARAARHLCSAAKSFGIHRVHADDL